MYKSEVVSSLLRNREIQSRTVSFHPCIIFQGNGRMLHDCTVTPTHATHVRLELMGGVLCAISRYAIGIRLGQFLREKLPYASLARIYRVQINRNYTCTICGLVELKKQWLNYLSVYLFASQPSDALVDLMSSMEKNFDLIHIRIEQELNNSFNS